MMRAWKDKMNVPIVGLLIDTLAYQFISSWEYRDESYLYYDYMCRDFFAFMARQDRTQAYWKAPEAVKGSTRPTVSSNTRPSALQLGV